MSEGIPFLLKSAILYLDCVVKTSSDQMSKVFSLLCVVQGFRFFLLCCGAVKYSVCAVGVMLSVRAHF